VLVKKMQIKETDEEVLRERKFYENVKKPQFGDWVGMNKI